MGSPSMWKIPCCTFKASNNGGVIRYSDFHIAPEEAANLIEELKAKNDNKR